jgi:hypothetical protein
VLASLANVLVHEPDLAGDMSGERLRRAERDLIAATAPGFPGAWDPEQISEHARGGVGLLVLEGLIVRRVGYEGRFGAELLGPGDLLRPWQDDGEDVSLPFEVRFTVIRQALFALLDRRFGARAAPYPEVVGALVGRAMQRSRTLVCEMAIAHYTRVDRRVHMLLWQLADRWGRVTPEGICIELHLTHELLGDLVAARRPSVTSAIAQLEREGHLSRRGDVWLLHAEPPSEFSQDGDAG